MTDATPLASEQITQEDREAAADWSFIECRHCSEYEGDFPADLAAAFARHRIAALSATPAPSDQDASRLREALNKIADLGSCGHGKTPAHKLFQQAIDIATGAL